MTKPNLFLPPLGTPSKPTLLVVDDEESVRLSLHYAFRDTYNVLQACNSQEAMAHVICSSVDLAILDIKMTHESGLDLLKQIKTRDPLIEIIMLTGYATMDYMQRAWDENAFGFVQKPFDINQLGTLLARAYKVRQRSVSVQTAVRGGQENELFHLQNGLIHDLNNILTAAGGMVSLLRRQSEEKSSLNPIEMSSQRDMLISVDKQLDMAAVMSQRYFRVIRMSSGDTTEPQTNIQELLEHLLSLLGNHAGLRNATFHWDGSVVPAVAARQMELFQILLNLAVNAAQSSDRPIDVRFEARVITTPLNFAQMEGKPATKLLGRANFANHPNFVALSVIDNGKGIPPEVLAKLFNGYFTTKKAGTGIGLPLIATLTERLNVLTYLETEVGRGTTVTVYIPAAR